LNIGIDLGGSHIALGVVNSDGKIVKKIDHEIKEKERENIKQFIETFIIEKYNECKQEFDIGKIGIAIPGTVSKTEIVRAINLGLENYKLVENLSKDIDIPIFLKNDGKCATIAENKYGCIMGVNDREYYTNSNHIPSWYKDVPERDPIFEEHTHEYDEIIAFFGSDPDNPYELNAELELAINGEWHKVTKSSLIYVPANMSHMPLSIKRVDKPIFHFSLVVGPQYNGAAYK